MAYETVQVEHAGAVAVLTAHRPAKRNALNATLRRELMDALDAAREDAAVRVVIITGAGEQAFIAGADVAEFAGRTPAEQRAVMEQRRVFDVVAEYPKPVLAMINGFALGGGCELALACDVRVAADTATLGQPEIRLGLIPGGGGTQRLTRLVGPGRALRLILTGELIPAAEALRIGLVDEVVPAAQLRARTLELAEAMAAHSPLTLQLAKEAVRAAQELPLAAGLARERELFLEAFGTEDKAEGVAAFLARRAPAWKGR